MKQLLLPFLFLSTPLWADSYQGTGKNYGEGWQRQSIGNREKLELANLSQGASQRPAVDAGRE